MNPRAAEIHLHERGLVFRPGATRRLLGSPDFGVQYDAIIRVTMVEPSGMGKGSLSVHVRDAAEPHIVRFRANRLREMRRLHVEIHERAVAARSGG